MSFRGEARSVPQEAALMKRSGRPARKEHSLTRSTQAGRADVRRTGDVALARSPGSGSPAEIAPPQAASLTRSPQEDASPAPDPGREIVLHVVPNGPSGKPAQEIRETDRHEGPPDDGRNVTPEPIKQQINLNEMYTLPGSDPLTRRDVERYMKSNPAVIHAVSTMVRESFPDPESGPVDRPDRYTRRAAGSLMVAVSEVERPEHFFRALGDRDMLVRYNAAKTLDSLPDIEVQDGIGLREIAMQVALEDREPSVKIAAITQLHRLPEDIRETYFLKVFGDREPDVSEAAVRSLGALPEASREPYIQEIFDKPDEFSPNMRYAAINSLIELPEDRRKTYYDKAFIDGNPYIRYRAAAIVGILPEDQRSTYFHQEFASDDPDQNMQLLLTRNLGELPERFREVYYLEAFGSTNQDIRRAAVNNLGVLPEELREKYYRKAYADNDPALNSDAVLQLGVLPEERREALFLDAFESTDPDLRQVAIGNVGVLPQERRLQYVRKGIIDGDEDVREAAFSSFSALTVDERRELIDEHAEEFAVLKDLATTTPLYRGKDEPFLRRQLRKSDTKTYLYDTIPGQEEGTLRNRVIQRVIPTPSYLSWKLAFESFEEWHDNGFDYVPIEPIVQAKPNRDNPMFVNVDARVLQGPTLGKWRNSGNGLYMKEIDEQAQKIETALDAMGIEHGHLHEENYVVLFNRDSNGDPDFAQAPRLYVIDFDRSEILGVV